MRFDRRKTYQHLSVSQQAEIAKAIVPEKIGGVIKSRGKGNIPVNVAASRIGASGVWGLGASRFNKGGVSSQFASDPFRGLTVPGNDEVTFAHDFVINGAPTNFVGSTGVQVADGYLIEATTNGLNFGVNFALTGLTDPSRLIVCATKVKGSFINWEGIVDAEVNNLSPGTPKQGQKEIISSNELTSTPTGNYGFNGISSVLAGDQFIIHWFAIVKRFPVNTKVDYDRNHRQ